MTPNYILKINELYTKFKGPLKLEAMLRRTSRTWVKLEPTLILYTYIRITHFIYDNYLNM
jgi:hypothetical protein